MRRKDHTGEIMCLATILGRGPRGVLVLSGHWICENKSTANADWYMPYSPLLEARSKNLDHTRFDIQQMLIVD